ncbi:TIGR03087 family PEP-CTERM/XrtA system glycosyltransferase [Sphingomonas yantingensis]|nr:TIGR03087 family PEP-CTERM/XrtA system glycosyltransferase [Sphingomonas yantingensis]
MGATLFLAHRVPYPPDRGDKIRGWHLLRHLAARGPVHLVTFADEPRDLHHGAVLGEVCASHHVAWRGKPQWRAGLEALASGQPVSLTAFADTGIAARVRELLARGGIDTIFVFSGQMAQYLPNRADARVVMDFCDVDSAKFASYAEIAGPPMGWVMAREARLLSAFEHDVATRVDASLFVSEAEAALFRAGGPAPRVSVVENGIDTAFFDPDAAFDRGAAVPGFTFTGQMDYAPNVEAACWFAGEVMPRLAARGIDLPFNIVGRAATKAVQALAGPHVCVTGEVADVRPWLAAARLVVAPLLTARGVQNKVLEAMAMARPIVASAVAAEGIEHRGTLSVAADADAFADRIAALLADRDAAEAQGRAARACVEDRYGWAARLAALDAILDRPHGKAMAA